MYTYTITSSEQLLLPITVHSYLLNITTVYKYHGYVNRSRLNYGRTVCYECLDDGCAMTHPSEKQTALRANATVAFRVDVARFWSEMMAPAFARADAVSPINRL